MSMKYNAQETTWTDYLPRNVFNRLASCLTTRGDIPILVWAKWQHAQDTGKSTTKEDCLIDILELLECNGLENVTELTQEEWDELTA